MFNSAYGAGFRAGKAMPKTKAMPDGTKVLDFPVCPFSAWRVISYALWQSGYYDGQMKRLAQPIGRRA